VGPPAHDRGAVSRLGTGMLGGRHDASRREHAEQAAECRSLKVPHRGQLMPPLLPKRISNTPARTQRSKPAIVDRIKPTPGSPATKSARQQPNGSSDIIERTTAKKIEAPRRPHTVTVIHTCRDHQRCSADPGLGFKASARVVDLHIGAPRSPTFAAGSVTMCTACSRKSRSRVRHDGTRARKRSAIGGPEGNQAQHRVTRDPASHDEAIPRWACGEP